MIFKVGDTVVYPHHGAALIEAIETRSIKGVQRNLVLKVAQGDLTVRVPADNAEYVGVRDVVGQEDSTGVPGAAGSAHRGAHQLVAPLQGQRLEEACLGRCQQGRRGRPRSVAPGSGARVVRRKKRMLAKARQILVGELALCREHR